MVKRVAIVGAGLSGLVLARKLRESSCHVELFEKSRGVGGRLATRYSGDYEFDHGAQFFTAKTPEFQNFLKPYIDRRVVEVWSVPFAEISNKGTKIFRHWSEQTIHYVGSPRMNSFPKALAEGLQIHLDSKVVSVHYNSKSWELTLENEHKFANYDLLVLAIPGPQAVSLLPNFVSFKEAVSSSLMLPCFSLMLKLDHELELPFKAALLKDCSLSWFSLNHSKPNRNKDKATAVLLSSNRFAETVLENSKDEITEHMLLDAEKFISPKLRNYQDLNIHRWLYANAPKNINPNSFHLDKSHNIACVGDYLTQGRVEFAFLSSHQLLDSLKIQFS